MITYLNDLKINLHDQNFKKLVEFKTFVDINLILH